MREQARSDQQEPAGLSDEELEQEGATDLPDREAMSLIGSAPLPMFPVPDAPILFEPDPARDTMPVESPQFVDDTLQDPEAL